MRFSFADGSTGGRTNTLLDEVLTEGLDDIPECIFPDSCWSGEDENLFYYTHNDSFHDYIDLYRKSTQNV